MRVGRKLLKGELVGRTTQAMSREGKPHLEGKIIDETKNTFVIQTANGRKRLVKARYVFEFAVDEKQVRIDGKLLEKRPEERIKTRLR